MRRHEIHRQSNTRVTLPIEGDWCELSLDEKRAHIFSQCKILGNTAKQPQMKCFCGKVVPIMFAYRCYECGAFWCPKCAAKHFSLTAERKVSK